jgi:phage host-nuclease inhibitor protein Gam
MDHGDTLLINLRRSHCARVNLSLIPSYQHKNKIMISSNEKPGVRTLTITSTESLDAAVARIVGLRLLYSQTRAAADADLAAVEKKYQDKLAVLVDKIDAEESNLRDYCEASRDTLFAEKKSRETALAVFGFELTPPRVETANRKIKWKDVVTRLLKLAWGRAYLTQAEPKPDKNALLADREKLTAEQLTAAGIQFRQDEQFYIRPKLETAAKTN